MAGVKKKIEARRKFFTQPLNDQVGKINAMFKEYSNPIKSAKEIMENKMLFYRKEQQKKIDKKNERIKKEAEKLAKKEGVSAQEIIESTEKKEIQQTVGTSTVTKRWTFEIVDEKKIPREYLELNEVKVNKDIRGKDGKRNIPGLRIFQKEGISTF